MKVGVIAFPLDRPVGGGIDRYVHRLAHEFATGPHADEFVWLHQLRGKAPGGAREVLLPEHGVLGAVRRRMWSKRNPEGLDVMFGPYFGVLPGPFGKVMTVHDLYAFTSDDVGARWTARFRANTKRMAKVSDWIIADSEASRKQVVEFLEFPAERTAVVHLGVDMPLPLTDEARGRARAALRAKYGWSAESRVVLFVGALIPRKDPALLLRAFARVHAARPDTRLLMLGARTDVSPDIDSEARTLGVADAVKAPGHATEADLSAAYAAADVFALPSRFEGFGLPVLEAMAHGVPVVCSTGGSLAEVAKGVADQFAPGDEAGLVRSLERLLDDEAERRRLERHGLEHARAFTWARCASQTYEVLARAAKR